MMRQELAKVKQATGPAPSEDVLALAGVSADRTRLLLLGDHGATFSLEITPRLRDAVRGATPRPGQLETTMDSALRPRDIQARIRAGETPENVAQAAKTTVEKIMAFVGPVLAERQHVAERAQRSNVRRPTAEAATGGRTLGDAVEAHLRSLNVDPDTVEWDAWRREDARWTLVGLYEVAARVGTAHFTFDAPGNYVVLEDDDARWLVGEAVASPTPARDDLQPARERRLTSLDQDELPLGDDAIELVAEVPILAAPDDRLEPELPIEPVAEEAPTRRAVQKKKGRASVPSWDEIMFGGSDQ